MMTVDQAIRYMRNNSQYADVIRDAYLGPNVSEDARRFEASAEFSEVMLIAGSHVRCGAVLDLGAGAGVASYAFAVNGARVVYAVEPDLSDAVGAVAARRTTGAQPIRTIAAVGEQIPLPDESVDLVYGRQVLHHLRDLAGAMRECARVLRHGGLLLATREHVVDNDRQLREFLRTHPVHALAGGENAFSLAEYRTALRHGGLRLTVELGPWDSIINAFPEVRSKHDFYAFPKIALRRRFGPAGAALNGLPGVNALVWALLRHSRRPGRLFSFVAAKA